MICYTVTNIFLTAFQLYATTNKRSSDWINSSQQPSILSISSQRTTKVSNAPFLRKSNDAISSPGPIGTWKQLMGRMFLDGHWGFIRPTMRPKSISIGYVITLTLLIWTRWVEIHSDYLRRSNEGMMLSSYFNPLELCFSLIMEDVCSREPVSSTISLWILHWSSASLLEEALSLLFVKRDFKKFMVGDKEKFILLRRPCELNISSKNINKLHST